METLAKQNEVIQKLNERLGQLKAASEIAVVDQQTLIQSGTVKLDLESYIRSVEHHFEEELAPAEETVRRVKLQMSTLIQPAKQWLQAVVNRQREWAAQEKQKAQREQEEINRKERQRIDAINAKAREEAKEKHVKIPEPIAAPVIKVEPSIPKVAGVKNQTYYYGELADGGAAIQIQYIAAIVNEDNERAQFLSRFLQVNEGEIGKFARETKDNHKAASLLPGVNFFSKG